MAALCQLINCFVGQCAGARDHTDPTWLVDVARHDANLALSWCDDAWAVGADQACLSVVEEEATAHFSHVANRYTFGDADDERNLGFDRFENGVCGEGWRDVDDGCVGTVLFNRFGDGVADGHFALPQLTAFTGSDTGYDVGAVFDALLCVKCASLTGDTLDD